MALTWTEQIPRVPAAIDNMLGGERGNAAGAATQLGGGAGADLVASDTESVAAIVPEVECMAPNPQPGRVSVHNFQRCATQADLQAGLQERLIESMAVRDVLIHPPEEPNQIMVVMAAPEPQAKRHKNAEEF